MGILQKISDALPTYRMEICPTCHGTGTVSDLELFMGLVHVPGIESVCPDCEGRKCVWVRPKWQVPLVYVALVAFLIYLFWPEIAKIFQSLP